MPYTFLGQVHNLHVFAIGLLLYNALVQGLGIRISTLWDTSQHIYFARSWADRRLSKVWKFHLPQKVI